MKRFHFATTALAFLLTVGCGGNEGDGDSAAAGSPAAAATEATEGGAAAAPEGATGNNSIEYRVSGHLEASGTEVDVMLCSTIEGTRWEARSLGNWVIGVEAATQGTGAHQAEFYVAAPQGMIEHEAVARDPRFTGTGQVTVEELGTDALGLKILKGEFSATGITNDYEHAIDISGTFTCSLLS